ncbi:MAG: hypothetical protein Q7R76_01595 [Candidatus Woesearchaeota archaeon]|nr:hypothetical protein [Candidatus Woesearchaeota archaeon]
MDITMHGMKPTDPDYSPSREERFNLELLSDMEREIYVDRMIIRYNGPFRYKELLELVEAWCRVNKYEKEIISQKHKVAKDGKTSVVSFQLHRKFTPLHISVLDVVIAGNHMIEREYSIDGRHVTLNEGDVEIVFNGFLMTHLKARWESRPKFALIRKIIDKFIYKLERPSLGGTVVSDAKDLAKQLRAAMIIYQYRIEAVKAEEEAQEKIAEELKEEKH